MTDYISREAVLELVEPDARPFLAERINAVPAADVRVVKRGKWIPKHHDDGDGIEYALFHCSVCDDMMARPRNFCPNCGADMREE